MIRRRDRGFVLPQVLLVVVLAAAWGSLLLAQSLAAIQRADAMDHRLRAQLTLTREAGRLRYPPGIGLLCLASPLAPFRTRQSDAEGLVLEMRWRHLGHAIILAELDVLEPTGGRWRMIAWLTPDSVAPSASGLRCGGQRLHPVSTPSAVVRPGE